MKPLSIEQITQACGGQLLSGDPSAMVSGGISTDTRSIPEESLFVALIGERFDAHEFLAEAAKKAAAIMVSSAPEEPLDAAVILVEDTLIGLQRLAAWYRRQLDILVVGITGSNGKTSTKDFTRSVLAQKFNTFATAGNLNNHIGVPLSILSLKPEHEIAVIEMGMNHSGEIAPLCEIASPDFGIITNIGSAHIENLGTRDAIAEEKSALGRSLKDNGTLLVPAACDYAEYLSKRTPARTIFAGNCRGQVRAEGLRQGLDGCDFKLIIADQEPIDVQLPIPGRHMVTNALLAAGIGSALGLSKEQIAAGLSEASISTGRLRRFTSRECTVIDDSYNANPESMAAALQTLAECPVNGKGRRYAVLGHMAELGEVTLSAHQRIGRIAAQLELDTLITVGPEAHAIAEAALDQAGSTTILDFQKLEDAVAALEARIRPGDTLLFKGSRAAAIERVMHQVFPEPDPA